MALPSPAAKRNYPFDAVTREQWLAAALPEWQGATPADKSSSPAEGIVIKPYYDVADLPAKINSGLSTAEHPIYGARGWYSMPLVVTAIDTVANRQALSFLNSGADGVVFKISNQSDPAILLKDIEFNYCSIVFLAGPDTDSFLDTFRGIARDRAYTTNQITGAVFCTDTNRQKPINSGFDTAERFYSGGLMLNTALPLIDSLASLLALANRRLNDVAATDVAPALRQTGFLVPAGTDFFLEIAKLKTLRMLWHQIAASWQPGYSAPLFIHSISDPWVPESWHPHGNMLKGTTAGMSAILGGCDALTILPEDPSSSTLQRHSVNISTVLREEAHFSKVADPTAGSYYVENLIDQLARAVWKKFQELQ